MKTKTYLTTALFLLFGMTVNLSYGKSKYQELHIEYKKSDVTCFGLTNGQIEIFVSGGKAPYIIAWDNGLDQLKLENLRSGEYSVKICDSRGKIAFQQIIIESPDPIFLDFNSSSEMFVDRLGGSMDAKIIGGTPQPLVFIDQYFIQLNDDSEYDKTVLSEDGEYYFTIEDANGCSIEQPVFVDFDSNGISASSSDNNNEQSIDGKAVIRVYNNDFPVKVDHSTIATRVIYPN